MGTNCLSVFDHFVGLALKGLRGLYVKMAISYLFKSTYDSLFINNTYNKNIKIRI